MAAVPELGRATAVEPGLAPEVEATRDLYVRYARPIFRYCLNQLRSREEAEDAVQVTFMNAFRGLNRGVRPDVEAAWLYKIASNVCLAHRRSSRRRLRVESPADVQTVIEAVPAPSFGHDELIRLEEGLASLPPLQRRAILLREWQGLSYREIATELEVTQATVETLIFRARRALAQALREGPQADLRRHARRVLDIGWLLPLLKGMLGGKAVELTAAAVSAAGVVVVGGDKLPQILYEQARQPAAAGYVTKAPLQPALGAAQMRVNLTRVAQAAQRAYGPLNGSERRSVVRLDLPAYLGGVQGSRVQSSPDDPPAVVPAAEPATTVGQSGSDGGPPQQSGPGDGQQHAPPPDPGPQGEDQSEGDPEEEQQEGDPEGEDSESEGEDDSEEGEEGDADPEGEGEGEEQGDDGEDGDDESEDDQQDEQGDPGDQEDQQKEEQEQQEEEQEEQEQQEEEQEQQEQEEDQREEDGGDEGEDQEEDDPPDPEDPPGDGSEGEDDPPEDPGAD